MPRASIRLVPLLLLSLGIAAATACASPTDDDGSVSGDEPELREGTVEARAVLLLVNDGSVTSDELLREARVKQSVGDALVAHRDGPDGAFGTDDDDLFDTVREVDEIPGIGPATIKRLYEYAKRKGLASGDTEVIFSPAPSESSHLVRIAKEIDLAQSSIDIAIYSYSDAKIGDALARAVTRGVKVRFVFNGAPADARVPLASQPGTKSYKLEQAGVNVRYINKIMHHKFMIVDGPRDDLAAAKTAHLVTGSGNWSSSAATRFDENTIIFQKQEELVLRFQREFDNMWAHSRDFVGTELPYELSTAAIPDEAIADAPSTHALFTSANFTLRGDTTFSSTGANTVADALVAGINAATRSIHIASGHLRSRAVAEALIAKKAATPALDVRVYLDGQEYIAKGTHDIQVQRVQTCLAAAGDSAAKQRDCLDNNFLFGYQIGTAGIDVRYKYYAYRWDHSYAPQMHHKFMAIDGQTLYSGSYNLSDNAEHATFENMLVLSGPEHSSTVSAFEANFESIWKTGREEDKLSQINAQIDQPGNFPIVFDAMALTWAEVSELKNKIRAACPAVDSQAYRSAASSHTYCSR